MSTVRRNNSPSTTRHSTENDVFIAKCAPREHYVDATAKVGPPLTEKLFISKSTREETAVGTASPVGCIMQRLFEVRLSFFSPFSFTFSSSPSLLSSVSLFSLLFALFRREAAASATTSLAKYYSRVVRISRDGYFVIQREMFHGEVD